MSHTLIWKDASDGDLRGLSIVDKPPRPPSGAAGLLGWIVFDQSGQAFRRRYGTGQIGELAAVAISQAIERGRDVTVGWGTANPAVTSADELEPVFRRLRPALLCFRSGQEERIAGRYAPPASRRACRLPQFKLRCAMK